MSGWQVLARGDGGISVSRCPEGHIHLDLGAGFVTIRLNEPQFISLAQMIAQALTGMSGSDMTHPLQLQQVDHVSRN